MHIAVKHHLPEGHSLVTDQPLAGIARALEHVRGQSGRIGVSPVDHKLAEFSLCFR